MQAGERVLRWNVHIWKFLKINSRIASTSDRSWRDIRAKISVWFSGASRTRIHARLHHVRWITGSAVCATTARRTKEASETAVKVHIKDSTHQGGQNWFCEERVFAAVQSSADLRAQHRAAVQRGYSIGEKPHFVVSLTVHTQRLWGTLWSDVVTETVSESPTSKTSVLHAMSWSDSGFVTALRRTLEEMDALAWADSLHISPDRRAAQCCSTGGQISCSTRYKPILIVKWSSAR